MDMNSIQNKLQNPVVKVTIIAFASIVKYYAPDEIDVLIDNALITFLGYHALSGSDKGNNA